MKIKLTKRYVDALPYSDKTEYHQDLELIGFAVRVGKKTKQYMVNKRINNKLHRVVIGDAALMTITEARDEAMRIMADIKQGIDPNKPKPAEKPELPIPTLRECYDYFKAHKKLSERSLETYDHQLLKPLADWLENPINDITKTMVSERHAKLTKKSPAQANGTMRVLRSVWNYCRHSFLDADEEPIIKEHPIYILNVRKDWNVIKPKKRHVEEEKLPQFFKAVLDHIDSSTHKQAPYSNNARDIMLLFMLTGVRKNEAQPLEWSSVDLRTGKILFDNTKNGSDYHLPMGNILWAMMKHRAKYRMGEKWVFPTEIKDRDNHIKNLRHSYAVISGKAGLDITPHDLRRTFISVANRLSMNYPVLKRLLNHRDAKTADDVTLQYVQISQRELRDALNEIERAYCEAIGLTQDDVIKKYFS